MKPWSSRLSIKKAGINATLIARTSILAVANPTGDRYDKTKPLKVRMPTSKASSDKSSMSNRLGMHNLPNFQR